MIRLRGEKIAAGIDFTLHRERNPNRGAEDATLSADDILGACELRLPEGVTDDGHRIGVANSVNLSVECPAENGIHAEHGKVGAANKFYKRRGRIATLSRGNDFHGDGS